MKLKQFESYLGEIATFEKPKYELEQYPTSAHIASRVLFAADRSYGDIEDKAVLDLGTGTGMLAIGAAMLGSCFTMGVDIDEDALEIAQKNVEEMEVDVDLVHANICEGISLQKHMFDTVVMNPPFGTRRKGADVTFLQVALEMSRCAVYSLHKSSTRDFLERKCTQEWKVNFEVVAQLRFDIPKMYKFHKKDSVDVQVDLIRLSKDDA